MGGWVRFPKPGTKIVVELKCLLSCLMIRLPLWVVVLVVAKLALLRCQKINSFCKQLSRLVVGPLGLVVAE